MFKSHVMLIPLLILLLFASRASSQDLEVYDFKPKKGSVGNNIIIYGKGFAFNNVTSNTVKFGEKRAFVSIVSSDGNQLVATVPQGAITDQIKIINHKVETVSQDVFEVIPTSGQIASSGTAPGPGDRKILKTYLPGFRKTYGSDDSEYYAPPDATLWVISRNDDKTVNVRFTTNWTDDSIGSPATCPEQPCKGKIVRPDVSYTISSSELQRAAAFNRGWDYGLLAVPYKYHPTDQSLTGEATLGGYAGYQYSWPGVAITIPVFSAGVGVVNVTNDTGKETSSRSAASFTVASGFIINLTKSGLFQIGALYGIDWAGKGNHYKYDGKPWIAISFGTNLSGSSPQ